MDEIYEPREDSYLILDEVKKYAKGKHVLDVGTGSGILAMGAALRAKTVLGVDINPEAVKFATETAHVSGLTNVKFIQSDLFSNVDGKYDLIIFNPPYLPFDSREPASIRLATTGGKKGYEIIERFFASVGEHLRGKILVLFSTLTGREKVHSIMEHYGFSYQKIAEEEFFSETIFVYVCSKSSFLREIEGLGVNHVSKLTQGHRGVIYTGFIGKRKVVVKKHRESSEAIGRMVNEARWLKVLNRKGIGPKLLHYAEDYLMYRYVQGEFLPTFIHSGSLVEVRKVLKDVLNQCYIMDSIGVNKEEMHNPYKHILVSNGKAVMLDFERCHVSQSPKNVTQFCQYISNNKMKKMLDAKGLKIDKRKLISLDKKYKKDLDIKGINSIL